jgi:HSP20 family protein
MNRFEDPFAFFDDIFRNEPHYDDVGDAYEFHVEVPGVKKENIQIGMKDNRITINTQRKIKDQDDKRKGSFYMPPHVDTERAEARVEDGILTIRLPKQVVATPRMIPIK